MKILQIFGLVVGVHLVAFVLIFATPGCQSSPRNVPTPDATVPTAAAPAADSGVSFSAAAPADLGTSSSVAAYAPPPTPGRATPTRPGSPNAVAVTPAKPVADDVAPVSTYTVQKGDSLWSIAKKNHLTVGELAKANSLGAGSALQPGKKLIIPGKVAAPAAKDLAAAPAAAAPVEKAATATRANGESVKHTVQPGEKLGSIARKYQISVGELASANGITDPAKIRVGQQLIIPGFKAVGSKPSGKAAKTPAKEAAPATETAAAAKDTTPHFEIKAPPPGQDLDAGLKDTGGTEVPTIKVEEAPKTEEPPKK